MIDIAREIGAIHRSVLADDDSKTVTVLAERTYHATVDDVWDAITDPERLVRWFLPISGDLREGGSFQLEGNAGGTILTCAPPHRLRVTFGGEDSMVEVRLSADGDQTLLQLEHTVPLAMAGSGAGALFVGPGWDGALVGLGLFLGGVMDRDPVATANSPEGQELCRQSAHAWATAVTASGTATADETAAGLAASIAHFAPDLA